MPLPTLRLISSFSAIRNVVSTDTFYRCDLDSHADTSCAGKGFTMLGKHVKLVNVIGYSRDLPTVKDVPVGTVCAAWTSEKTGQAYLLVLHECLYMPDRLDHSLLCRNQIRSNGLIVDDTPNQYSPNSTHSIHDRITGITIPLHMH
jgi:hypothetical protein